MACRLVPIAVSVALLLPACLADGTPEVVRVLAMGTAYHTPILANWFVSEPSTDPTIIPTREWGAVSNSDILRFMRIYFPRSYEDLLEYGFIMLASPDMSFITPKHQNWLYDSLCDHRRGAANTRSIMQRGPLHELWRVSILSSAFPNDVDAVIADQANLLGLDGPLVIADDPDLPDLMKPFKKMVEPLFPDYGGVNAVPREGAVILSYTRNNRGVGSPVPGRIAHVFYWKWNRSTTFTFRDMPSDGFWGGTSETGSLGSNPYGVDIMINIIWWSTGRDLPRDPLKVHDYRRLAFEYGVQRSLLTTLLEFAEYFGAESSGFYDELGKTEEGRRRSGDEYLHGEFDRAHETIAEALGELVELQGRVMELKDRALFWVHLVEWLVTTGVLLISGVILWALMVRRALYRETTSTHWRG